MIRVLEGDCRDVLPGLSDVDAVVTDPPYHLTSVVERYGKAGAAPAQHGTNGAFVRASRGFMGKEWDGGDIAFRRDFWQAVHEVMKPGAHLVAFGGSRTFHRMAVAIEDAGFELRDTLMWVYGSGFPKSHNISVAIDKAAGAVREVVGRYQPPNRTTWNLSADVAKSEIGATGHSNRAASLDITAPATPEAARWQGWGSALKPSFEPIILARKPLDGTLAGNTLRHGVGGLNVDACRVEGVKPDTTRGGHIEKHRVNDSHECARNLGRLKPQGRILDDGKGRWPANLLHDGSDEVLDAFPSAPGQQGRVTGDEPSSKTNNVYGAFNGRPPAAPRNDTGTAARFFYSAKASKADRAGSKHPTIKPVALMQWLCRLVTPPGGTILDPFAGSGTTGQAAMLEGFNAILIEQDAQHATDIRHRIRRWSGEDCALFAEVAD